MNQSRSNKLCECVEQSLRRYFRELNGEHARGVYAMVLNEIERPLLITVMRQVANNQSEAAKILGINRNTLRKKLAQHEIQP